MTAPSAHLPDAEDPSVPVGGGRRRHARRPPSGFGAMPLLARHIARTMPWLTLGVGCVAGVVYLAILAEVADSAHWSLTQGDVRVASLPAITALAFALRTPFRAMVQATPVPAWVAPAGHLLLAAPLLMVTCWAQLGIMSHTVPAQVPGQPADYPLLAQLTGWCAVTVAVAACVDRSRYADLGGAIAAPVSFAVLAIAWYTPVSARLLDGPPATAHGLTIAWYTASAAALALTCIAMRDRWHRYARRRHWLRPAAARRRG